jgi:hypothetical protein
MHRDTGMHMGKHMGVHMACTWHAHGVHLACTWRVRWQAIAKMEALQLRMSEIERWFASVKAEAAGERQMREQASK